MTFFKLSILIFILFSGVCLYSQTPGMIFETATGGGAAVLDPNGDGWVSATSSGFVSNDESESEIPFVPMIFPMPEPDSDLGPGPDCGFTDFVQQAAGVEDAGQYYLSPANNWLFRLRMGSSLPNSKSYSILIDSDQKFGATGPNKDPNYVTGNPGFEIEIVLATNFGVYVYNVDGTNSPGAAVISYAGHTNYQKSISISTECGNPDYFYDFFVDFDDLISTFGVFTSTPFRMILIDNMAADKSSINNASSRSDLGGVDDAACGNNYDDCFDLVIDNYTPCAAGADCPDRSECPSINSPILNGATSVSGTSTEIDGTTIKVYINGTPYGTTTSVSGGTWTLSGIAPTLATGNIIGASAQVIGEGESIYNCGLITVTNCTGAPGAAPVITSSSGKNICGTGTIGYDINVYYPNGTLYPANPDAATSTYLPVTGTGDWVWKCTGNTGGCNSGSGVDCIAEGSYAIYQLDGNGCVSIPAFECISQGGGYTPVTSNTPTIISSTVYTGSTSVQVTITNNIAPSPQTGYIYLFVDNAYYAISGLVSGAGTFAVSCTSLPAGASVTARYVQSAASGDHDCISTATGAVTIYTNAVPPIVTGSYCSTTAITSVSGTSIDPTGTIIQVYENGIAEGSTTTVTANGTWTASVGISIALGSTITAKAQIGAGPLSSVSNSVIVYTKSTNAVAITTVTITEGDASVSGSGTDGDVIKLYVDGIQVGGTTVVASGIWTISGLGIYDLYATGIVTATATTGANCESNPSASKTVVCSLPLTTLTVDPANETVCSGSVIANVQVYSSQSGIIYQLFNGVTATGVSKLGTGGTITLTSGTLISNTTLEVKAIKIPVGSCSSTLSDNIPVTVNANPTLSLTVTSSLTVCSGSSTNVIVQSSQLGFSYQLRNDADDTNIGSAVAGTGGNINLPTGALTADITFNILVTGVTPSFCNGELTTKPSITITSAPSASVLSGSATICNGLSTNLNATITGGTSPYDITIDNGIGTISNYNSTDNISVSPTSTTTYSITSVTDATGCPSVGLSGTPTVTVNPLPTATISATTPICDGVGTTLSITLTGTADWIVKYSDGSTITTESGISTSPFAINLNPGSTTTYTLTEVSDANCTDTTP
ncbi:MAG: hypothetical protein A2046_14100 [Bacteroidetes bacterium GWA2_30_7]|nr:MAG: hypothetical protein A2046_14100 [Bacteroidetes bacterium GWA2_30_7]